MTRPMPEPLECTCMSRGNSCWTCVDTIGWDPEEECPSCPVHAGPTYNETKRLTDAECAAEYWRAEADALRSHPAVESWSARPIDTICREHIWHRFATTPHALEIDGATS